jgi:hypothetical protein
VKKLLPLLGILFLVGCGPTIQISPPTYPYAQEPGVINIAVDDQHNQLGKPVVHLFPKYQPFQLMDLSDKLQQTKPDEYALTLPNLEPDEYRIVVEIPYIYKIAGLEIASSQQLAISDFVIHQALPANCFRFDNKEKDLMDWASHGVYIDNRDKPVSKETCPGLFYINSSWPYPLNDNSHGGSLFVPISSECFPKTSPQLSQPSHWTFALVSPDLRDRPDWQHLQAIRFHMATRTVNLSVRPEVQYILENANHSTLNETQTPSTYEINGGRWNDYEYDFKLPQKAIISHVIFHVYGVPEKTVSDQVDSLYLDAVCPVK